MMRSVPRAVATGSRAPHLDCVKGVETRSLPLSVLTSLRRYLGLQSRSTGLTISENRAAEADGPAVILIDKEETFERV